MNLKCPRCGRKWIRANPKYRNLVCRNCGKIWIDTKLMPENEQTARFVL